MLAVPNCRHHYRTQRQRQFASLYPLLSLHRQKIPIISAIYVFSPVFPADKRSAEHNCRRRRNKTCRQLQCKNAKEKKVCEILDKVECFGDYQASAAVSSVLDHLLRSFIQKTWYCYFVCMPTDSDRRKIKFGSVRSLLEENVFYPRYIVHWSKRYNLQDIKSMKMTSMFEILPDIWNLFVPHEHEKEGVNHLFPSAECAHFCARHCYSRWSCLIYHNTCKFTPTSVYVLKRTRYMCTGDIAWGL